MSSDKVPDTAAEITPDIDQRNGAKAKPKSKRKASFFILFIIILALGGSYFYYYHTVLRFYEETDDAYVNGNMVILSPQITGTVTQVKVDEGDYVEQGQTLVTLDSNNTQIALQVAEANLASAIREVRGLYSNVDNFRAQVEAKKVAYNQAQQDYSRRRNLAKRGAISKEDLSHYRDALTARKNELTAVQESLKTTEAMVDDTMIGSHPEIQAAVATVRQRFLDNERTNIVAPVSGYIAKRAVQLGGQVQQGTTLMSIVPLDEVWVDVNFKENQMREMRIGQAVELTSDLYGDDVIYHGKIESLGVGTGSAFSLLPAQNASGNWIKIVQRVAVKVTIDKTELDEHPLRIGLSMLAKVDIKDQSGSLLASKPHKKTRYGTDVYDLSLSQADALIAKIMHANMGSVPPVEIDTDTNVDADAVKPVLSGQ